MPILSDSVSANGSLAHTRSAHRPMLDFPPSMPSPDDIDFLRVADFGPPLVASPGITLPRSANFGQIGSRTHEDHGASLKRINPRTPSRPLHTDREWSTHPASTTTSLSRPGILHGHPSTPSWQTYNHYSPSQSSSSPTISISSSSSGSSTQSSGTEGSRGSITSRVKRTTVRTKPQVSPKDVPPFEARPEQYKCPLCEYVQTNRRIPDLKKHHELHFRDHYATRQGEAWVCCGIPIALAAELGLVDKGRVEQRDRGVMVGGCGQAFSNKDNYRRHLRDAGCFGDHDGSWVPGNAK